MVPLVARADSVCKVFRTAAARTGGPGSPEAEKSKPSSSEESSSSCGVKLGELRSQKKLKIKRNTEQADCAILRHPACCRSREALPDANLRATADGPSPASRSRTAMLTSRNDFTCLARRVDLGALQRRWRTSSSLHGRSSYQRASARQHLLKLPFLSRNL